MGPTLLGTKIGMTRVFTEDGASVPVTVLQIEPNVVTQVRTPENDGYAAVQIGYGAVKARNSTIPMIGHDAKAGTGPKRAHREFHVEPKALEDALAARAAALDAEEAELNAGEQADEARARGDELFNLRSPDAAGSTDPQ